MQSQTAAAAARTPDITQRMIGYMLAHEQFPLPELVQIGAAASRAGRCKLGEASDANLLRQRAAMGAVGRPDAILPENAGVTHPTEYS